MTKVPEGRELKLNAGTKMNELGEKGQSETGGRERSETGTEGGEGRIRGERKREDQRPARSVARACMSGSWGRSRRARKAGAPVPLKVTRIFHCSASSQALKVRP